MAKKKGSKRWRLTQYDVLEALKYVGAIALVVVAGNLTGLQSLVATLFDKESAVMIMALLGPFLKRLAEDYEKKG